MQILDISKLSPRDILRKIRHNNGLTQERLAQLLGMHQCMISDMEGRNGQYQQKQLKKLR